MDVIVVGDPAQGFDVFGPFDQSDGVNAAREWARCGYGGADWWQCPLLEPPEDGVSVDAAGTFVVNYGSIASPFILYGPFATYEIAKDYAARLFGGWVLELTPIDREDIEVAA